MKTVFDGESREKAQSGMCLRRALLVVMALLSLTAAGCVTGGRRHGVWPKPIDKEFATDRYYYAPRPVSSVEEAIGTIKNLQANLSGPTIWDVRSLDVDKYGLRMSGACVATRSEWVPTYGGFFVGSSYVPVYGGAYQNSSQQYNVLCVVPFKEVDDFQLARPKMPKSHWGYPAKPFRVRLIVGIEDKPAVCLLVTDEKSAQQLLDSMTTLMTAVGHNQFRTVIGALLHDLTEKQKADSKIAAGVLVSDVYAGSPAEKAGLQFLDIIVKVDGAVVPSVTELKKAMEKASDSILLSIRRLEPKRDENGRKTYVYTPHDLNVKLGP